MQHGQIREQTLRLIRARITADNSYNVLIGYLDKTWPEFLEQEIEEEKIRLLVHVSPKQSNEQNY